MGSLLPCSLRLDIAFECLRLFVMVIPKYLYAPVDVSHWPIARIIERACMCDQDLSNLRCIVLQFIVLHASLTTRNNVALCSQNCGLKGKIRNTKSWKM